MSAPARTRTLRVRRLAAPPTLPQPWRCLHCPARGRSVDQTAAIDAAIRHRNEVHGEVW